MSISLTFPFTSGADYVYDSALIEVTGGKAQLKLVNAPGQLYQQVFTSDVGFVYDNTKAEFTGSKVQQKDQRPAGATFFAAYTTNINASWSTGVGTGTAAGGAAVSSGKLDLKGGTQKYVTYSAVGNAPNTQTGCVELKYKPNYSGVPAGNRYLFDIYSDPLNDYNSLQIYHNTASGNIYLRLCDTLGNYIYNGFLGVWTPVSGTEYTFSFNFDFTAGATRLFINGTQFGATVTNTGTRIAATYFRVGAAHDLSNSDGEFDDIAVYSTVQHTVNYTPGSSPSEYMYAASKVTLPLYTNLNPGAIQSIDVTTVIEGVESRYTIGTDATTQYYWTGAAWAVSNQTYAQASTSADILANLLTLSIIPDTTTLQIIVYFNDGNVQDWVDDIIVEFTDQNYSATNPTIEGNAPWINEGLEGFTQTPAAQTGSDEIKYNLKKGTSYYWHNSVSWAVSNGTYTQANTAAEILANKATFTTEIVTSKFKAFLHSANGTTTPQLDTLKVDYNYAGESPDAIHYTILWGYRNIGDTTPIKITPSNDNMLYKLHTRLSKSEMTYTVSNFRANGYWEQEVIDTENMSGTQYYNVDFGDGTKKSIQVTAVATLAIEDVL